MTQAADLATAHWEYINSVLEAHEVSEGDRKLCGFHYRTAFIHGYKHGQEDAGLPYSLEEIPS